MPIEAKIEVINESYSSSPSYLVSIHCDNRKMAIKSFYIEGHAQFYRDRLNWVHLGGEEPNPDEYDLDPVAVCEICGDTCSIYTTKKRCSCVPF
jgi:hypothetical protein